MSTDKLRYSKDSSYQVHQRTIGAEPGEGRPWTNEEKDTILELWFSGRSIRTMAEAVGRTDLSVQTCKDKIFSEHWMHYPIARSYEPGPSRTIRMGHWSEREEKALKHLDGRNPRIIGRTDEDVRKHLEEGPSVSFPDQGDF